MASSPPLVDMDTSTPDGNHSLPNLHGPNFTTDEWLNGSYDDSTDWNEYLDLIHTVQRYYLPIIIPVTCVIIMVIGSIGNLLVILSVSLYKQMRTRTNVFIVSLAVADLLFIVGILPFDTIDFAISDNDGYLFGPVICKIKTYTTFLSFYGSIFSLLGVSFNRFLAVVFPISSMTIRTRANATKTVLVLWLIILLANIPSLVLIKLRTYYGSDGNPYTSCEYPDYETVKIVHLVWFGLGFALPLALMCIMYGVIAIQLLRRRVAGGSIHGGSSHVKTRAIRMCAVVVAVFTICWLPYHSWQMRTYYGEFSETIEELVVFYFWGYSSIVLAYVNSCLNPILYAFLSAEFRSSFKKLMCCNSP